MSIQDTTHAQDESGGPTGASSELAAREPERTGPADDCPRDWACYLRAGHAGTCSRD